MYTYKPCNINPKDDSLLLKAHVVDMGVSFIHDLLLQQLLNDILNGDDAHRRRLLSTESCCARYTALRRLQCHVSVSHDPDDFVLKAAVPDTLRCVACSALSVFATILMTDGHLLVSNDLRPSALSSDLASRLN